jgi:hypothetical protein
MRGRKILENNLHKSFIEETQVLVRKCDKFAFFLCVCLFPHFVLLQVRIDILNFRILFRWWKDFINFPIFLRFQSEILIKKLRKFCKTVRL